MVQSFWAVVLTEAVQVVLALVALPMLKRIRVPAGTGMALSIRFAQSPFHVTLT